MTPGFIWTSWLNPRRPDRVDETPICRGRHMVCPEIPHGLREFPDCSSDERKYLCKMHQAAEARGSSVGPEAQAANGSGNLATMTQYLDRRGKWKVIFGQMLMFARQCTVKGR